MTAPQQSARTIRRAKEREEARAARKAAQHPAKPAANGASAAAATTDPDALAAAMAAAGAPPLTMDQIPPEAQKGLTELLKGTGGDPGAAGTGKTGGKDEKPARRPKKFIDLERELGELLMFPAGPALMAGDQFCAQHFAVQGPALARQLTIYSESHAATYDTLLWMARQGSLLVIATAVVGYLLPPAIHHGLPAPGGLRKHYGMAQDDVIEQDPGLSVAA